MSTLNKSSKEPWLNFFGVVISALIGVGGTVYIATRSQGQSDKPNTTIVVQTAPTSSGANNSEPKSPDETPNNSATTTEATPPADSSGKADSEATPLPTATSAASADINTPDVATTPAGDANTSNANPNVPDGFTAITDVATQCPPDTVVYNSMGHEAGVVKAYDATKGVSILYKDKPTPTWMSESVFKQAYFLKSS